VDRHTPLPHYERMVTFTLEKDTKGFHAWSPELPGVHTHGATRAAALANLKDAVRLYVNHVSEESVLSSRHGRA
jgi:predicted RNase H-like HicB family nuclease